MKNDQISQVFEFIGAVLQAQDADRFRIRAYQTAAETILNLDTELKKLWEEHYKLEKLPGIGKTIAAKLDELFSTGNIEAFQKYVAAIPEGMWSLQQVRGVGPKHAYQLAITFNLDSHQTAITKLTQLAIDKQVQNLDGWGQKSEQELLQNLQNFSQNKRIPYQIANQIAESFVADLSKNVPNSLQISTMGSLRRQTETVGDIDIGIGMPKDVDFQMVKNVVENMKNVKNIEVAGDQVMRVFLDNKTQIDIKAVPLTEWGSFLQHYTGSKQHNILLREWALKQNKSLSEHGIKDETGTITKFTDEAEFYAHLGLKWIPPSQRTGTDEIKHYQK